MLWSSRFPFSFCWLYRDMKHHRTSYTGKIRDSWKRRKCYRNLQKWEQWGANHKFFSTERSWSSFGFIWQLVLSSVSCMDFHSLHPLLSTHELEAVIVKYIAILFLLAGIWLQVTWMFSGSCLSSKLPHDAA